MTQGAEVRSRERTYSLERTTVEFILDDYQSLGFGDDPGMAAAASR